MINSFDDCKRMLIGHQSAVIDRPTLYTFHGVISSTQGFTIGSSPWDESCKVCLCGSVLSSNAMKLTRPKNKRKAAGQTLGRPSKFLSSAPCPQRCMIVVFSDLVLPVILGQSYCKPLHPTRLLEISAITWSSETYDITSVNC